MTAVVGVFLYVFLPIVAIVLAFKAYEWISSSKTGSQRRVTPPETRQTRLPSAREKARIESEIREKERKIREGEW